MYAYGMPGSYGMPGGGEAYPMPPMDPSMAPAFYGMPPQWPGHMPGDPMAAHLQAQQPVIGQPPAQPQQQQMPTSLAPPPQQQQLQQQAVPQQQPGIKSDQQT